MSENTHSELCEDARELDFLITRMKDLLVECKQTRVLFIPFYFLSFPPLRLQSTFPSSADSQLHTKHTHTHTFPLRMHSLCSVPFL